MPDKIEEILKSIHTLFAKGASYQDSPDRVIVSKTEMFELLEELNEELYAVMDRYEATARSREQARLEQDRQAAEIVAKAKKDSDDVHAATLIYTDKMLDEINEVIEKTRHHVKHDLLEMLAEIELRQETLERNKEDVRNELTQLHDDETYLKLLENLRREAETRRRYGSFAAEEEEVPESETQRASVVIRVDKPGENSGVTYSTRKSHKNKKSSQKKPKAAAGIDDEEIEINPELLGQGDVPTPRGSVFSADDFNLDAEYEQWKEEQEGDEDDVEDTSKKTSFLGGLFGGKKK